MYIGLSVILTGCLLVFVNYTTAINYENLIVPICKRYGTNTVSIFTSSHNLTYENWIPLHKIIKTLSTDRIATSIISYKDAKVGVELRNPSTARSLVVTIIDTKDDFQDMLRLTHNAGSDYRIWLIVFNEWRRFCIPNRRLHFHMANQRLGDKTIIFCRDSKISHKFLSYEDNFLERYSLDGRALRVAVILEDERKRGQRVFSLAEDILVEISRVMNVSLCKLSFVDYRTVYAGLLKNAVDITNNFYQIEYIREAGTAIWTTPVLGQEFRLYFRKEPINLSAWNTHFRVMTTSTWLVIAAAIFLTILLLTAIKYIRGGYFFPILYAEYSHTWGMYCGQGLPEIPNELPSRIVCITTLLSALIISSAYSSLVLSYLAVPSVPQFTTLEDFLDDGTYRLIQYRGHGALQMFPDGTTRDKMLSLLEPKESWPISDDEALKQVCTQKVAYYSTHLRNLRNDLSCDIATINLQRNVQAAYVISPRSNYRRLLNYHIQKLRTSGVLQRLKSQGSTKVTGQSTELTIGFHHIVMPFTILGMGLFLASVIFITEVNWKKIIAIKKSLPCIARAFILSKYDPFSACKALYVATCRKWRAH